jgi:hypothetical protein
LVSIPLSELLKLWQENKLKGMIDLEEFEISPYLDKKRMCTFALFPKTGVGRIYYIRYISSSFPNRDHLAAPRLPGNSKSG